MQKHDPISAERIRTTVLEQTRALREKVESEADYTWSQFVYPSSNHVTIAGFNQARVFSRLKITTYAYYYMDYCTDYFPAMHTSIIAECPLVTGRNPQRGCNDT